MAGSSVGGVPRSRPSTSASHAVRRDKPRADVEATRRAPISSGAAMSAGSASNPAAAVVSSAVAGGGAAAGESAGRAARGMPSRKGAPLLLGPAVGDGPGGGRGAAAGLAGGEVLSRASDFAVTDAPQRVFIVAGNAIYAAER